MAGDLFKEHRELSNMIRALRQKFGEYDEVVSCYDDLLRRIEKCESQIRNEFVVDNDGIVTQYDSQDDKYHLCSDLELIRECLEISDSLSDTLRCFPLLSIVLRHNHEYVRNLSQENKDQLRKEIAAFLSFSERALRWLDNTRTM